MRRSESLKLVLVATTAIALTACSEQPQTEGNLYKTVDQCIGDGVFTEAACRDAFYAATELHKASKPRYDSMEVCEEQHGYRNCIPQAHSTGTVWAPFMAGYFLSSLLNDNSGWDSRTRPFYTSRDGGFYSPGGHSIRRDAYTGKYLISQRAMNVKPTVAKVQTRTTVAARGGFGSRSTFSAS